MKEDEDWKKNIADEWNEATQQEAVEANEDLAGLL